MNPDFLKMNYNPQPYHTADGRLLEVGMTVWAVDNDTGNVNAYLIKEVCEGGRKVIFLETTAEPGIGGWRVDGVFFNADIAKAVYEARFVHLRLDVDSAGLICQALAQRLKQVLQEVRVLQITKERDLTRIERSMLQSNMMKHTREELQDNIDHWIGYAQDYEYLLKDIDNEIERAVQFSRDLRK
jgi:hypothetical protein